MPHKELQSEVCFPPNTNHIRTSPSATNHAIPTNPQNLPDKNDVQDHIDDLWDEYFVLLDMYMELRRALSEHFADGFMNLASANFVNPRRMNYGKYEYDERMQATTVVKRPGSKTSVEVVSIFDNTASSSKNAPATQKTEKTAQKKSDKSHDTKNKNRDPSPALDVDTLVAKLNHVDPLNWYGILVPQALRDCQASFRTTVLEQVGRLASIDHMMMAVEIEIRRARKVRGKIRAAMPSMDRRSDATA